MKTTIQIDTSVKETIASYGSKNDSYNDILKMLLKQVEENQLAKTLMDDSDSISLKEAKKEWDLE